MELFRDETKGVPHLLDNKEVGAILGISPKQVYNLPIRQTRPKPRRVRYHPDDVKAFIDSHREGT